MITNNKPTIFQAILAIAIVCAVLFIALPSSPVQAAFPPRPEPPVDQPSKSGSDNEPGGAHIELQVHMASSTLWTIVQWTDSADGWHNVEGWQGTLDQGNKKLWQVAATEFGKGPFRWVLYQSQGGQMLAISKSFHLPRSDNETVKIEVSLAP